MKKRVLSMILMVCMIVSLLVGFTVSAAAEAGIVTYTLKDGDTVLKACQKNGIDFYAKQKLIAAINNITDYRSLPVGFTVKLPTDAYVASASTAAASAVSAGSSAVAVSGAATTANIAVGDTVSYYLIKYQMKSGDTVAGVCNGLGVNFGTYSSMIKDINRIGSWNNVKAGSTILIPSATTPPVGTSCYAVVAHTVASGETATSICASYGMSYGANEALLKAINNKSNLNSIMRGSSFLVPVSTTIKGSGTVPSGSGSSSSSSSSSSSTVSSKTYSIKGKIVSYDYGADVSYEFLLNGKAVTKAAAGQTVTVKYTNNNTTKYVTNNVYVLDSKDKVIKVSSKNTFTMPESDATVVFDMVSVTKYDIQKIASTGGTVTVTVDGATATKANAGKAVVVTAKPKTGYELQRLSWSTDPTFATDTIISNGTFEMPEHIVYIKADFTKASAHTIYDYTDKTQDGYGSVFFKVGGTKTTSAWGGYTVQVDATPSDKAYSVDSVTVTKHNDITNKVVVDDNNCFVMPGYDVDVFVTFKAVEYRIKTGSQVHNGTVKYTVDGVNVTKAAAGDTVDVHITPTPGYRAVEVWYDYTDANDNYKLVGPKAVTDNEAQFTMPASDVCVVVNFEKSSAPDSTKSYKITQDLDLNTMVLITDGDIAIDTKVNGTSATEAYVGDEVVLEIEQITNEYNKYNFSAYYTIDDDTDLGAHHAIPIGSPFDMPAADITYYVEASEKTYKVSSGTIKNGSVRYTDSVNEENDTTIVSDYGHEVVINLIPADDYEYIPNSLVIKNRYNYDVTSDVVIDSDGSDGTLSFRMPASSVTVTVNYRRQIHELPTLTATSFEYRVMIDGKLVKLDDAAVAAKFKDDKYATTDYGAGNGKFYYGKTIYVYYTGGTFDKDAWDFLGTDIYGNPYTTKNGIGTDANGYYFTFKANAVKPATIVIS